MDFSTVKIIFTLVTGGARVRHGGQVGAQPETMNQWSHGFA